MKSKVLSILLLIKFLIISNNISAQYSVDQIQGIWVIDENLRYPEQPCLGSCYNIFHKNRHLYISTCDTYIENIRSIQIGFVGFVNSDSNVELLKVGSDFVFSDDGERFYQTIYFQVFEKHIPLLFYLQYFKEHYIIDSLIIFPTFGVNYTHTRH